MADQRHRLVGRDQWLLVAAATAAIGVHIGIRVAAWREWDQARQMDGLDMAGGAAWLATALLILAAAIWAARLFALQMHTRLILRTLSVLVVALVAFTILSPMATADLAARHHVSRTYGIGEVRHHMRRMLEDPDYQMPLPVMARYEDACGAEGVYVELQGSFFLLLTDDRAHFRLSHPYATRSWGGGLYGGMLFPR